MSQLVYLIGSPGAGKTTIMKALTPEHGWTDRDKPFAHRVRGPVTMLGRDRAGFGGTDTLGMSVARTAENWISACPTGYVLGEGDRLSYEQFFRVAIGAGYTLRLFHIDTPASIADTRRTARAAALGAKTQNENWVKGRATKAARLAELFNATRLDGCASPARNAATILGAVPELAQALS